MTWPNGKKGKGQVNYSRPRCKNLHETTNLQYKQ